ncbi:UNKNOWN [Stylonychia lemnae]|uniref:Uncharacterized protein n=1 Tax=Stylonychia lemnae TaxID=5949 RepID=A0A078AVY2_STYLE|nr:UNKNOWN [Stylonychia lemnae]|eukprot:CDW86615.1 UNKNOWN [Stylonychia lemnae]
MNSKQYSSMNNNSNQNQQIDLMASTKQHLLNLKQNNSIDAQQFNLSSQDNLYNSVTTQKEQMLKKLLESQETYIQELEIKNKDLKDQIVILTNSNLGGNKMNFDHSDPFQGANIDLNYLERPEFSSLDKSQYLMDKVSPISGIIYQSLTQLKISISLEQQLLREEFKYKDNVSRQGNQMMKRERQELQEEFESIENQYRLQIKGLEHEIRILKDIQHQSVRLEKDQEVRLKMVEELDQLVMGHKRREEDLSKENQVIKLKLDKAFNTLQDQIAQNETSKARHERLMLEKDAQHQSQYQQLQKLLKDTIKELQRQKSIQQVSSNQFTIQNDSSINNIDPNNQSTNLTLLNNNKDKTQKLTEEVEQFLSNQNNNAQNSDNVSNNGSNSAFDSMKHLKAQLENQEKEAQHWRECVAKMADKFKDQQDIYDEKLRVIQIEKKNLQEELRQFVKIAGERENLLTKENNQLKASNKQLMGLSELREKLLQEELIAIKSEIKNIQKSYGERELQHTKERDMFQKEIEEYQILVDQIHHQIENQRQMGAKSPNELQMLQSLAINLQKQLGDANDLLGKNGLSNSKSVKDLFLSKLDNHMIEQKRRFEEQIQGVNLILQSQKEHQEYMLQEQEAQDPMQIRQFNKILNCLQSIINSESSQNKSQSSKYQPQNSQITQKKGQGLNNNNSGSNLGQGSKQMQDYYQQECEQMWNHIQLLEQEKQQQIVNIESLSAFINNLMNQQQDQHRKYGESFEMHQQAIQTLQQLISNQFVEFENLRLIELKAFQESQNQQSIISRESSAKSFGGNNNPPLTSKQSQQNNINNQLSQQIQNWQRERTLLFEEITLLRSQIELFNRNYSHIMSIRQQEFQILKSERKELHLIQSELQQVIEDHQSIDRVAEDYRHKKQDFMMVSEEQIVVELTQQNEMLEDRLRQEKRLHEEELMQMNVNFEAKIIELKEKEASKDFFINKLTRELELVQSEYSAYTARNDQIVLGLNKEIERLRKFLNDRQQDYNYQRQKMGSQLKKMKDTIKEKDEEVNQVKNEKYQKYLKLLNTNNNSTHTNK